MSFINKIKKIVLRNSYTNEFGKLGKGTIIQNLLSLKNPQCIEIGEQSYFLANARLDCWTSYENVKLKPRFIIGDRCSFGFNCSIMCSDDLFIDDDVMVGSYVLITTLNHGCNPESDSSYQRQPLVSKKVHINRNVWIGDKVTILPGVEIGENAIIGANSVVTKNIPANSIAVGIPAKVVKRWDFSEHKWIKI